jgi:hypothetical protein
MPEPRTPRSQPFYHYPSEVEPECEKEQRGIMIERLVTFVRVTAETRYFAARFNVGLR